MKLKTFLPLAILALSADFGNANNCPLPAQSYGQSKTREDIKWINDTVESWLDNVKNSTDKDTERANYIAKNLKALSESHYILFKQLKEIIDYKQYQIKKISIKKIYPWVESWGDFSNMNKEVAAQMKLNKDLCAFNNASIQTKEDVLDFISSRLD
jgi:hypothetical protein